MATENFESIKSNKNNLSINNENNNNFITKEA